VAALFCIIAGSRFFLNEISDMRRKRIAANRKGPILFSASSQDRYDIMRLIDHITISRTLNVATLALILAALILAYTGNVDVELTESIERTVRSVTATK
jgi:hypothetical protein